MTHPTLYMFVCLFIWVSPVAVCCWSIPTYIAALCLSIYTTRLFPPLSSYVKSVVLALQSPIACPQMERRYSRGVIASTTEFGAIQERKRGIWLIVTTNTISLLQRLKGLPVRSVQVDECVSPTPPLLALCHLFRYPSYPQSTDSFTFPVLICLSLCLLYGNVLPVHWIDVCNRGREARLDECVSLMFKLHCIIIL